MGKSAIGLSCGQKRWPLAEPPPATRMRPLLSMTAPPPHCPGLWASVGIVVGDDVLPSAANRDSATGGAVLNHATLVSLLPPAINALPAVSGVLVGQFRTGPLVTSDPNVP